MLKKKLLVLFVIASVLSSFTIPKAKADTVFQQEMFPLKEMQVQVMPEFDYPQGWSRNEPSLLVGQYGTITNKSGQDYDGKIEIPVPAKDKSFQINLVAEFPEANKPEVQRPFNIDKEKGIVSWKPQKAIKNNQTYKFVIEYYTKAIDVKDKKSFTYQFTNKTGIDQLNVIFYAPMNAKDIQLEPKAQNNEKSDYGEQLYYYQYQNVKAGVDLKYTFSYKKEGTESTMEAINKQQPPNDDTHSGVKKSTATDQVLKNAKSSSEQQPIISTSGGIIIAIAIIIAGVFVFFGRKGNTRKTTKNSKPTKQHQKPPGKKENKSSNADEKKELRKKLLLGKIDQETYDEEMKKLI
jgi:hypothetical protein